MAHLNGFFLINEGVPQGQAHINIIEQVKISEIISIILANNLFPFSQLYAQSVFIYKDSLANNHNIPRETSMNFSYGIADKLFGYCNRYLLL